MTIYQELILSHYRNPKNYGQLKGAKKSISLYNPLCGDKINMDISFKKNKIFKIKFSGGGCAISQAASSMLTEFAKGKTKEELINLDKNFMIRMLAVQLSPSRVKCALLPLEALQKLIIL